MQIVKRFFNAAWEIIVEVQTSRAAEHLARTGRYAQAREIYLGPNADSKIQ